MLNKTTLTAMLVFTLCLAGNAFAADTDWTGSGDGTTWTDSANWDNGVPTGNEVITQTFGDVTNGGNLLLATGFTEHGEYRLSDGSVTVNNHVNVAHAGTGYMELSGDATFTALGAPGNEYATFLMGYYQNASATLALLGSGVTMEVDSFATLCTNNYDKFWWTDLSKRTLRFGFDSGGTGMIDVTGDNYHAWRAGDATAFLRGELDLVDLGGAKPGTYTVMRADKIWDVNMDTGANPGGLSEFQLAGSVDPELWSFEIVGSRVRGDGELDELRVTLSPGPQLFWDGTVNDFHSEHWEGGILPTAGKNLTIDDEGGLSVVTVAADFTTASGTGPAESLNLGLDNTASLIVNSGVTLEVTSAATIGATGTLDVNGTLTAGTIDAAGTLNVNGTLTTDTVEAAGTLNVGGTLTAGALGAAGTLNVDGTLIATSVSSAGTLAGSGTIDAGIVEVSGLVTPGGSGAIGTLSIQGSFEMFEDATYRARIDNSGADLITSDADVYLDGTLELQGTEKLDTIGDHQETIVQLTSLDEQPIEYSFATIPADTGKESHIGFGQFFRGITDVDAADVTEIDATVFQAAVGDTDGNAVVDILDILSIKTSPKGFGKAVTDAEWTDGDFVGATLNDPANGTVDILDILAIKQLGLFGTGPYADGEEGGDPIGGAATLTYDAATGELSLANESGIESLLIESAAELFIGEADPSLATFVQLDAELFGLISFGGPLAGGDLGPVLPAGLDEATLLADLTATNASGAVISIAYNAVPEPGTLAMLALGLIGLMVWRRKRAA